LEETDCELVTLDDVTRKAKQLTSIDEVYSRTWLKTRLKERYRAHITFSEVEGRMDVICWKEMASFIVNSKWYECRKQSVEDESMRIVATAAKLLKAAIREVEFSKAVYPTCADISSVEASRKWMPELLNVFLDNIIPSVTKKIAIGNSIVQAVRPKSVIAPAMFGTGISVDHICGSKRLINLLYHLGFSISYDEVLRFKQSAVQSNNVEPMALFPEYFTQYAADNVDHNVCTIDGLKSFHVWACYVMLLC
jgi:hypothetical protein